MGESMQERIAAIAESKRREAARLREVASWISLEIHRDLLLDQAKELESEAGQLKDEPARPGRG